MRCPVYKADNVQPPQCRRCKADLTLLFGLEQQRDHALADAQRCLAQGRWREAVDHAAEVNWLRSDVESRRLLAVAHLLARDFSAAWAYYRTLQANTTAANGQGREADTGRSPDAQRSLS